MPRAVKFVELLVLVLLQTTSPLRFAFPRPLVQRRAFTKSLGASASAFFLAPLPSTAANDINKGALEIYNKAINLQATGNIAASLPLLARVTDMEPTFPYGWSSLADVQVALGDVVSAQAGYREAIRLCSSSDSCKDSYLNHLNLGCVLINLDRPSRETLEEGLKEINIAARLRNRPDPVVVTNRAIAYDYLGKYALAVEDYEIAVRLDGEVKPWWLRRAESKLELGDGGGAKEAWKRVEARFPESAEVNAVGTVIFQALGEESRVDECYKKIAPSLKENYSKEEFKEKNKLRWGPKMTEGWKSVVESRKEG
ncbi:hypothetical protein TrLO_g683 [Triparma laevis f. longispina]|uniref:Uncharacterized protein n=1 Tax=Triparma laevis f. longispina TaxID=1714387 RepID=A0A9W7FSL6_9STRA|nr:hypothetical protein TrLO_g683 [Triparma laevis f. longispina]